MNVTKIKRLWWISIGLLLLLVTGACSSGSGDPQPAPSPPGISGSLTVADVETLITQAVEQAERQGASIVVAVTNREAVPLGAFQMTGSSGDLDLALEKSHYGSIPKQQPTRIHQFDGLFYYPAPFSPWSEQYTGWAPLRGSFFKPSRR